MTNLFSSAYFCVQVFIIFEFVVSSELTKQCPKRTVSCLCKNGEVRIQDGVLQCRDEKTNICKDCVDKDVLCDKKCSPLNTDLIQHRQKRGVNIICWDQNAKQGKPFIHNFVSQTVMEGRQAVLFCNVTSNPKPQITWTFQSDDTNMESKTLVDGDRSRQAYYFELCNQRLVIPLATPSFQGTYTCSAKNSQGFSSKNASLLINQNPTPQSPVIKTLDLSSNSGTVLYLGRTANLTCRGFLANRVSWTKNSKKMFEDDLHIFHQPKDSFYATGILEFKNISHNDSGSYICTMRKAILKPTDTMMRNLSVASCPSGSYCTIDNNVFTCPSGSYCPADSDSPVECSLGDYCPEGSTEPSPCPEGYECIVPSGKELIKKDETFNDEMEILFVTVGVLVSIVVIVTVGTLIWKRTSSSTSKSGCFVSSSHTSNYYLRKPLDDDAEQGEQSAVKYEWDVFICYSSKDGEWVRDILMVEIEKRGLKACIDIRDFVPGEAIVQNIVDAIYGSRKTVAVLSPDYVKSDWCKDELQRALTRGVREHHVVPILYRPCKVPYLLQDRTYLDWNNAKVKPHFWDLLEKALQPDLRVSAV